MTSDPNLRRWDGKKKGHYEVWYVTFNVEDRGYWIRTTLRAPHDGPPEGALWFLEFVPGHAPRAWKEPIDPPGSMQLRGKAGEASWDIRLGSEGPKNFRLVPATLRPFVGTKTVAPHLDARVSGTLRIGDKEIRFENARGSQTHLWGKGYGRGWAWAHANFDGGAFEGLGGRKPAIASLFATHEGRTWNFNTLFSVIKNRSITRPAPTGWRFGGTSHNREIAGKITCNPLHMAGVTYHGTRGEKIYCYNTEIAQIALDLKTRQVFGAPWKVVAEIRGTAHYEIAGREPIDGIPILID